MTQKTNNPLFFGTEKECRGFSCRQSRSSRQGNVKKHRKTLPTPPPPPTSSKDTKQKVKLIAGDVPAHPTTEQQGPSNVPLDGSGGALR